MTSKKRLSWGRLVLIGIVTLILAGIVLALFWPYKGGCGTMPPKFFSLDWHPNGRLIAAGGTSGIFLYSDTLENVTPKDGFGKTFTSLTLGWNADGSALAVDSYDNNTGVYDSGIQILDAKTYNVRGKLAVPNTYEQLHFFSWSPDGSKIAGYSEKRVSIWSTSDLKLLGYLDGHKGFVHAATWSPDSKLIASSGLDGMTYIWNVATRQRILSIASPAGPGTILLVKWSPVDSQFIATGATDGLVRLWDTNTGNLYRSFDSGSSPFWISSLAWSHDGKRIVLTSDRLQIWDVVSGQKLFQLKGHEGLVEAVAWSTDDRKLVSAGNDGTIRIWDTNTGKLLFTEKVPGKPLQYCVY